MTFDELKKLLKPAVRGTERNLADDLEALANKHGELLVVVAIDPDDVDDIVAKALMGVSSGAVALRTQVILGGFQQGVATKLSPSFFAEISGQKLLLEAKQWEEEIREAALKSKCECANCVANRAAATKKGA
jgi:hypothetical protein